jgi:hypothetical protein
MHKQPGRGKVQGLLETLMSQAFDRFMKPVACALQRDRDRLKALRVQPETRDDRRDRL